MVRGFVRTTEGVPIANAVVAILGHVEFGSTVTQANGEFDMAANGGTLLNLIVRAPGYLDVQRTASVSWNSYNKIDDVTLTRQDSVVTPISLDHTDIQVARGSIVTSEDGPRRGTLLFPSGVTALMHNADGTAESLPSMNVRITEFTAKRNDTAAMPAALPAQSAYTYAFEVNADEAVATGAPEVTFSMPLAYYVENFLDFPTGTVVPLGSLDRTTGTWKAAPSGVVLKVLDVTGGVATIDLDGDSVPDTTSQLAAQGITTEELIRLADIYPPGQTLWRVLIPHFTSPWDTNWNAWPPDDADRPSPPDPQPDEHDNPDDDNDKECKDKRGSAIGCESQTLHEDVPIAGTTVSLHYSSARARGRASGLSATIPITGSTLPVSTKRVDVQIAIAGQSIEQSFAPTPNASMRFTWNGKDVWGRPLLGSERAKITISNIYDAKYIKTPTFGASIAGSVPVEFVTNNPARGEINLDRASELGLHGVFDPLPLGFGGWTLSAQDVYQPGSRVVNRGDGTTVGLSQALAAPDVGGSAASGAFIPPLSGLGRAMVIDPLGNLTYATGSQVFRIQSNTQILVAGASSGGIGGEEVPATRLALAVGGLAFAPDGSLVLADDNQHKVFRITTDGVAHRLAGRGIPTSSIFDGDGSAAANAQLFRPISPAVTPDGTVYFIDSGNCRVRSISTDGTIRTVLGTGCLSNPTSAQQIVTEGPGAQTYFQATALAVDGEGTLYAAHLRAIPGAGAPSIGEVFAFDRDGKVRLELGCKKTPCGNQDGISVLSYQAPNTTIRSLAADWSGNLYFTDANCSIRTFHANGIVTTMAGGGACSLTADLIANGAPATSLAPNLTGVAFGPSGLFAAQESNIGPQGAGAVLFRITSPLPSFGGSNLIVPDSAGRMLDVFDPLTGRHLQKIDGYTGSQLLAFNYQNGLLASIVDLDNRTTTIERTSAGPATAIVSPDGQRTTLQIDSNGYLSSVIDPAGGMTALEHTADGLLSRFTNGRNIDSIMSYDSAGRLLSDVDAVGGSIGLARTDAVTGGQNVGTVTKTTAQQRITRYEIRGQSGGGKVTRTMPDGTANSTIVDSSGTRVTAQADGTVRTTSVQPDRLYGLLAGPLNEIIRVPSGLVNVITRTRSYTTSPGTFVRLDTETRNGNNWKTVFNRSTLTETTTTPENRVVTRNLNQQGRVTSIQIDNQAPLSVTFNGNGRVATLSQGGRVTASTYFPSGASAGYLAEETDPLGVTTAFSRDALGHVLTETRLSSTTTYTWDPVGNLTSVSPPDRPAHALAYTPVNLLESYIPPAAGLSQFSTTYTYDADRMLRRENRPDGLQVVRTPNDAGNLSTVSIPGGLVSYEYYPAGSVSGAGRTSDIHGPYDVDLHFSYDGMLTKSVLWSGGVTGGIAWNYNTDFNRTLETVTGATGSSHAAFGYDHDQLLTCVSPTTCSPAGTDALKLARDSAGIVRSIVLGNTTESLSYNPFGELATQGLSFQTAPLVAFTYDEPGSERDALGRVVQKTEVIGGTTNIYRYTYDALRRLTDVTLNGSASEHFDYDANGNRTLGFNGTAGTTAVGTYDDQDRLLSYGPFDFTYTANGELETKTNRDTGATWLFQYDALGNLLTVGLPNGDIIDYLVDGIGRRVGRKKNGVLQKQWIYRNSLKPAAEFDGNGTLVSEFVYGSRGTVPDYVVRGGATYRVISDQLGSPRYVVNVANASDVPFMASYTSFGEVTGTGLDWMPFGFAGGIHDDDTGAIRFGAREYDPTVGRWLSKDSYLFGGADADLYAYLRGDPVNWVDLNGHGPYWAAGTFVACEMWAAATTGITYWEMGQQLDQINSLKLQKAALEKAINKALDCDDDVDPNLEQLYNEVSADLLKKISDYSKYNVGTDLSAKEIFCALSTYAAEKLPTPW